MGHTPLVPIVEYWRCSDKVCVCVCVCICVYACRNGCVRLCVCVWLFVLVLVHLSAQYFSKTLRNIFLCSVRPCSIQRLKRHRWCAWICVCTWVSGWGRMWVCEKLIVCVVRERERKRERERELTDLDCNRVYYKMWDSKRLMHIGMKDESRLLLI